MTNNEAKFVLSAYRPNGSDANDPAMRDAIKQAKGDPSLNAWFGREQSHDAVVAAKLREIMPPAGLRDAIVAGVRAGESNRVSGRRRWHRPVWLAMAAAITVMLGITAFWRFAPVSGTTLDEYAVNFVSRGFLLSKRSADLTQIKSWLTEHRLPLPADLPSQFDQLHALGCRTVDFEGREISLVCFERGGKEFHVFVARRSDFPALPVRTIPEFGERRNHVAAMWSDDRNHYVMVSDAGLEAVKQLL